VAGIGPSRAFAVDAATAMRMLDEICRYVASAGFRRIILYSSSPANESVCEVAAREIRIGQELQMFSINLGALGLDPDAASPEALAAAVAEAWGVASRAPSVLSPLADRLLVLFGEIQARAPLSVRP
jgi:hypothetical protein